MLRSCKRDLKCLYLVTGCVDDDVNYTVNNWYVARPDIERCHSQFSSHLGSDKKPRWYGDSMRNWWDEIEPGWL